MSKTYDYTQETTAATQEGVFLRQVYNWMFAGLALTGGAAWFYSLPKHDKLCHPAEKMYNDYLGAVKYGNIFSLFGTYINFVYTYNPHIPI